MVCPDADAYVRLLPSKNLEIDMDSLIQGYEFFRAKVFPQQKPLFEKLAVGQQPEALLLTCSDSRVVPDMILQTRPGDLFICRNAGNIVPPHGEMSGGGVSATIEYAVGVLNVPHIIICGHSDCGAMKAVANDSHLDDMPNVASWLRYSESAKQYVQLSLPEHATPQERLRATIQANVVQQLSHLRTYPSVAARLQSGQIALHGWTYDIAHGTLAAFDAKLGQFMELERNRIPKL
jgi:carbonic anhydrase